jgi:hypothetical protein
MNNSNPVKDPYAAYDNIDDDGNHNGVRFVKTQTTLIVYRKTTTYMRYK